MNDNKARYIRTDMATERLEAAKQSGTEVSIEKENGFQIHRLTVEEQSSELPPMGKYVTVTLGKTWLDPEGAGKRAVETLSCLIGELCEPYANKSPSVLAACLGNRRITADAVGAICADNLIVTRHLKKERQDIYRALGGTELSAITPGVVGDTGIETCELIRSAVDITKPDIVIAVDALAARSVDRLTSAIQLSDAGIAPGSGIGNRRKAINRETVGVPVISIGVPTVVLSSTLVWDALNTAGIDIEKEKLSPVLENGRSFFVTPKDADISVSEQAKTIARAINLCFLGISQL